MNEFKFAQGYSAGAIGRIAELHAVYYSENWDFGEFFETKVATELSEFICNYNEARDRIFTLSVDGVIEGSISIDGSSEEENIAHLRWFIMSDKLKGKGAGNYLMKQAMTFCAENSYDSVYLWTFRGLGAARHLYEKYGFKLTKESSGEQWGSVVTEQRFDADLKVIESA
jgi:GNAT superfamily N-acetyltransferase